MVCCWKIYIMDTKNTSYSEHGVVDGSQQHVTRNTYSSFSETKNNLNIGLVLNSISVSDEKLQVKKIGSLLKVTKYYKRSNNSLSVAVDDDITRVFNVEVGTNNLYQAKTDLRDKIKGYFTNIKYFKFITLTFDPKLKINQNKNLYNPTDTHKCVKQFILKLQSKYGYFKYIWVVEPHPTSGRMHYHMLADLPYIDKDVFHSYWVYGERSRIECPRGIRDIHAYMAKVCNEMSKYLDKTKNISSLKGHKRYSSSKSVRVESIVDHKSSYVERVLLSGEPIKTGCYSFSNTFFVGDTYWFLYDHDIPT
jgi:hypothetical protein